MINFKALYRSFWANLRNVITSSNFVFSVVLLFGVLFAEIATDAFSVPWRQYDQTGFGDSYFFNCSIHFGYYIYAAPLLCAFASSWLFCDDAETGFYRSRLMLSGKKEYSYGLFLGTTVGGGFALMTGVLLFILSLTVIYLPYDPATGMAAMDAWKPLLHGKMGGWHYMMANAMLAFLFGMVWSGVGLLFSILSQNRYISYLSPFMLCFSMVLVLPAEWQPLEMLVQMNWVAFSFEKLFIYQSVLYISVMLLFIYIFERKIIHGQN
ncbi:MAG: hypothetical protein RR085_10515 [Clostridia bacterium]